MPGPMQTDHLNALSNGPDGEVTSYARADAERRGLEADQSPLRMNVSLRNARAVIERLGLPKSNDMSDPLTDAVGSFVANLALIPDGHAVFYSRDKTHYGDLCRYRPAYYTYSTILTAVEYLDSHGFVTHERTPASPLSTHRSSVKAKEALSMVLKELRAADISLRPPQCIVLRGSDKAPLPYRDTEYTRKARRAVEEQNQFMGQFSVTVEHAEATLDDRGFLIVGKQRFCQTACFAHRVYSESFRRGGRWYGPYWQVLPGRIREEGLRINGERVIELDYQACHFRIMCHLAGVEQPDHDPFKISPFLRSEIKLAFNIMLNASHPEVALGALTRELSTGGEDWETTHARSRLLLGKVVAAFPAFANYWNTCFGLQLQYIDSEICRRVLEMLRHESIPAPSVHDSFIVAARHSGILREVMKEGFEREMRKRY